MSQSLAPYGSPPPPAPLAAPTPIDAEQDGGGVNLLAVAWAGRWLILLCTLLGGAAAWGYLQRVTPRYTSVARIYVEQSMPKLLNAEAAFGGFSNKYLYTQAELIRSTSVLAEAIESPEARALPTIRATDNPIGLLKENLRVEVGQQDDIINVSIELPNANDAATIVNAVVDAYVSNYAEQRKTSVVDVLKILRSEKVRRDEELERRREALESFRAEHSALAVHGGEDNAVTNLYSALSQELNAAQIGLLEAKTRYRRVQAMVENPDQLPFVVELARAEQTDRRVSELDRQIQNLEQQLITERARWGEGYPSVKLLRDSLAELREQQAERQEAVVRAYVDTLRQNYELLTQRRDELQRAYDEQFKLATRVSRDAAKLASLEEAYEDTKNFSAIIDKQIQEVNLTEEVGAMNVSRLEIAQPGFQTYPDRAQTASLGLAFGAIVGFGLAWLRDLLDQRLKSVEEIASTLQTPVLGTLPVLAANGRRASRSEGGRVVALEPRSLAAEAVRTLRTTLQFAAGAGASPKVVVVTSPAPGDGKSTVASNLAIAMAHAGQRVLLVDADMRKPTQSEIFGGEHEVGLSSVLSGEIGAERAIGPSGVESLDLLPCGPRPSNPVELLNNGRLQAAMIALGEAYDQIVIDSPPVMPVADARIIASLGDATLLVLRAERSTRRLALGARDELLKVRAPNLGVVVNAAPIHRASYNYGYGYGYGGYGPSGYSDESGASGRGREARQRKRLGKQAEADQPLAGVDA